MELQPPATKRARVLQSPPDAHHPHVMAARPATSIAASTAALNEVRAAQPPKRRSKRARPRSGAGNSPYYPASGTALGESGEAGAAARSSGGAAARRQAGGARAPSPIQTGQVHRSGGTGASARGTGRSQLQGRPRQAHQGTAGPGRPRSGPATRRPVAAPVGQRGRVPQVGSSLGRSATTGSTGITRRRRGGHVASRDAAQTRDVAVTAHSSLYASLQSLRAGRGKRAPAEATPVTSSRLPGVHFVQHADIPPVMDGMFATLRRHEMEYRALPDAFVRQPNLQPYMRMLLLEWMMEVCQEYRLKRETFHLAVNFTDRFVSLVSCLLVAARRFACPCFTSLDAACVATTGTQHSSVSAAIGRARVTVSCVED